MGNFYVKFERWDPEIHAVPKLVPSYGGWVKFRGIPLHLWNMKTFTQVGDVCGGFVDVSKNSTRKLDLYEAVIKVKDNFCGFIPTTVRIADDKGGQFSIRIVTPEKGKWLVCRNPKVHGTFTREAALEYDEFDAKSESFVFRGNEACTVQDVNVGSDSIIVEKTPNAPAADRSFKRPSPTATSMRDKGKKICTSSEEDSQLDATSRKRVSFFSPKKSNFLLSF